MYQVIKKLIITLFIFITGSAYAQDITGGWHGSLDISGIQLRLVLHISANDDGFTATMDSPDQGATGIPVGSVTFKDDSLQVDVPVIGARYIGKREADTVINGQFYQGGQQLPLRLIKKDTQSVAIDRPQEPKPPFPYDIEEVRFANDEAGITLAGTLTRPKGDGPFPAVILITGSGPQNRDEELFGHKPFWVIADHLTRTGIAVLRFDDRGVGNSTGDFAAATTADFASDTRAAFHFLRSQASIASDRTGLLGHSEGGMVAPMVAADEPDVAFLVLLAAPGISIDSLMLMQSRMIGQAGGQSAEQLDAISELNRKIYGLVIAGEEDGLEQKLYDMLFPLFERQVADGAMTQEQATAGITQQTAQLTSPWMRYFLKFEPDAYLRQVTCPVLALNGSRDLQVAAKENLAGIQRSLQTNGNNRVTVKELPGLNHLFQETGSGLPSEYGTIAQTISPAVLNEISGWILQQE